MYSTARRSFGVSSTAAFSPRRARAARARAAANGVPPVSSRFSASANSGVSSTAAVFSSAERSPLSLPKESASITPAAPSSPTPPRAKLSAEERLHGSGSSITSDTPPAHRSFRAGKFIVRGRLAALHKIAGHDRGDGRFRAEDLAYFPYLVPVSAVKRIIFRNDPDRFHINPSFFTLAF